MSHTPLSCHEARNNHKMYSSKLIHRITLFKIPEVADQEKLLAFYKEMSNNAKKVRILLVFI